MLQIIHHPTCSKCIGLLEYLQANQIPYEHRDYMRQPLDLTELEELVRVLAVPPLDIIRQGDPLFQQHYAGMEKTDAAWIQVLAAHPQLLQRPLIIKEGKGIIGRPLEKAFAFILN